MSEEAEKHEKTEDPTQKKLDDARKKGDVAKSQEVSTWFVIAGSTFMCAMLANAMATNLASSMKGYIEHAHAIPLGSEMMSVLWRETGLMIFAAIGLPLCFLALTAIAGNLVQHRAGWTVEPMKPKLSKISPVSGFKRLFSRESLVNFAKGIGKLAIVASVMTLILWPERERLDTLVALDIRLLLPTIQEHALKLMAGVLAILTVIAGLDWMYQKQRWFEKQKMTVREVKDEFKQTEGDPTVRAKLRQVRMERGRQRMISRVPEATVVVTNPTHYSVALQYEASHTAPVCVAKGVDAVALKIREIAEEHDVPILANPPLARALYASVEIDEEIPHEHYKAVAKVIGYVMQLRNRQAWRPSR